MPLQSFQSPSGVLGVCRRQHRAGHPGQCVDVSVPFRGFRGLQATFRLSDEALKRVFQSPSGVLGVCRICWKSWTSAKRFTVFQSPSGVLGVCRRDLMNILSAYICAEFQSPSGVLGVCRASSSRPVATIPASFQSPSGVLGVCRRPVRHLGGRLRMNSFSPLPGF